MKNPGSRPASMTLFLMALLVAAVIPVNSFGQGRGRGRNRDDDNWKCGKFVNCHDARDGRVDGRGPNRSWQRRSRWQNNGRWWDSRNDTRYRNFRTRENRWWDNNDRRRLNRNDNWRWDNRFADRRHRNNWTRPARWRG